MHWFAMVASLSPTVSVMKAGFLVVDDVLCRTDRTDRDDAKSWPVAGMAVRTSSLASG